MTDERMIEILAKAARQRLDLLEDGETSLAYYGEADEIRAALAAVAMSDLTADCPHCGPDTMVTVEREPSVMARGVFRCTGCGGSFEVRATEGV